MKKNQQGSATLEVALSIPLLAFLFLLLVQVAVVMLDQLAVTQAAREAARAAAVSPSSGAAVAAGRSATRLRSERLTIEVDRSGGFAEVEVSYRSKVVLPIAGTVLFEPTVSAHAAMSLED